MARLDGPRVEAQSGNARSLAILLHGYGADGADLIGLAPALAPHLPDTTFLAPNAPEACAVNPMGRQWFSIPWLDGSAEEEMLAGIARAIETLNGYLDDVAAEEGIGPQATCLVGFSQGTMMSLHVGPRRPDALAGIVGFSGRLLEPGRLAEEIVTTPDVLLVHGDQDEMLPVQSIHDAREGLAAAGINVRWHISQGVGHGIAPDGLGLAAGFLQDHLP